MNNKQIFGLIALAAGGGYLIYQRQTTAAVTKASAKGYQLIPLPPQGQGGPAAPVPPGPFEPQPPPIGPIPAVPFPGGGGGPQIPEPQPPQGGINLPPGGVGPGMPGVEPIDPCATTSAYMPGIRRYELPDALWFKRLTYDVALFNFASSGHSKCPVWRIYVGFCIQADVNLGLLDSLPPEQAADVIWHIRNKDNAGIDWANFKHPLVWKWQGVGTMSFKKGVAQGGMLGALTKQYDIENADACPELAQRWPKPTSFSGYDVLGDDGEKRSWNPNPVIEMIGKGQQIYARITFAGFPVWRLAGTDTPEVEHFNDGHYHAVSHIDKPSREMTISTKVWAAPLV
jgi:hypothetical protein